MLRLEPTVDTPLVILDPAAGHFEISGKSYPEDTREFYQPVLAWMDQYVSAPNPSTRFVFKLKYFNSSSYKPILDILTRLASIKTGEVAVEWCYKKEDTDMLEAGEEFADLVNLRFTYTPM
jgi:hypothetical protein